MVQQHVQPLYFDCCCHLHIGAAYLKSAVLCALSHVLFDPSGRPVLMQLLEASLARLGDRGTWTQWQWNEQARCFETAHAFRYADRNCCMLSIVHCSTLHTPHTKLQMYIVCALMIACSIHDQGTCKSHSFEACMLIMNLPPF